MSHNWWVFPSALHESHYEVEDYPARPRFSDASTLIHDTSISRYVICKFKGLLSISTTLPRQNLCFLSVGKTHGKMIKTFFRATAFFWQTCCWHRMLGKPLVLPISLPWSLNPIYSMVEYKTTFFTKPVWTARMSDNYCSTYRNKDHGTAQGGYHRLKCTRSSSLSNEVLSLCILTGPL